MPRTDSDGDRARRRVSRHGRLRAYVRRLHAHPAFHTTILEALQDDVS